MNCHPWTKQFSAKKMIMSVFALPKISILHNETGEISAEVLKWW